MNRFKLGRTMTHATLTCPTEILHLDQPKQRRWNAENGAPDGTSGRTEAITSHTLRKRVRRSFPDNLFEADDMYPQSRFKAGYDYHLHP